MAKTKTKRKSSSRSLKSAAAATHIESLPVGIVRNRLRIVALAGLVLVGLAFLVYKNKGLFVAALVNGQPILRSQLNDELNKRYGARTLDAMVSEKLVADEIKKQNIQVNDAELDARVAELSKSLPEGMTFADALKAQGMTEPQFKNQLRLQLGIDKLLSQEVSVSATEIDNYIKDNRQNLPATKEAVLRQQVEDNLKKQKIEELFQGWFASLKEKASIQRFL
ncbi:SurA N-terminal domain-containing protein [Candidatus Woesebacteria bacterium]|nr:SurA N-terminal domain-containing protein [Candidatus Woesebacteria bacterium]